MFAWGSSPVVLTNENRYYVSFIDTSSRFKWLFPISQKSNVMNEFLKFQTMVKRLFNTKIKSVQADWGVNIFLSTNFSNQLALIMSSHSSATRLYWEKTSSYYWYHSRTPLWQWCSQKFLGWGVSNVLLPHQLPANSYSATFISLSETIW
jgi:hypothetical protein